MSSDLVATWRLPLPDGDHKVEFEHGTTSGKRVIIVDGKVCSVLFIFFLITGCDCIDYIILYNF
jgi:hypothetical protein